MDLETYLLGASGNPDPFVEPGVFELKRIGRGKPRLLIELPHGATEEQQFRDLEARLQGDSFPEDLVAFFFVNTDVGTPECAREIAHRFVERETAHQRSALILRSLIPRTFVDCNRVVEANAEEFLEAGVTQAVPDYVRDAGDLELLISLHEAYQYGADRVYREVCGAGGLAITLHSYAPRSVGIDRVDDQIVQAIRDAYRAENWDRWPIRPEVDVLDRDLDGHLRAPESLVEDIVHGLAEIGLRAERSSTYRLHPSTAGYRHACLYPDQVICLEFRRDLLADPFEPFAEMRISDRKVARICAPVAAAVSRFLT